MSILIAAMAVPFLLGAASSAASNCTKPGSPVDATICHEPDLSKSDAELSRLYFGLRSQVTSKSKAVLLTQQRAWLAERNRVCATGEPACLRAQYGRRLDELQALGATAEASDQPLRDVTPVVVKGNWKATAVQDPAGTPSADQTAVPQSLSDAGLPAVGAMVRAAPGKLCLPGRECETMGWTRKSLAKVDGGEAIARVLGLKLTDIILVGTTGAKWAPYYELVPRSDGSLWAVFGLCGRNKSDCRNAVEVWTAASADASISPRP